MNAEMTTTDIKHITVCICTYKRPELLRRLFDGIGVQETSGLFTFSIVVVDNDHSESAKKVVAEFISVSPIPATYCVEPRQSIALARNKAIENAKGDFVTFIDDDEFPTDRWLLTLFVACCQNNVDGVLGPVKPHFDEEPPRWIVKGKFYERETYPTGFVIDWRKGRTGNVILRRRIFAGWSQPFNPEFRTGEDQHFFLDAIEKGHVFIWCNEAVAYEVVPPIRWKRTFMLRRALLRGSMEPNAPTFGLRSVAKSLLAIPLYVLALPFALMAGQDKFMGLLVRLCDHLGKILAVVGINPIKDQYVTE